MLHYSISLLLMPGKRHCSLQLLILVKSTEEHWPGKGEEGRKGGSENHKAKKDLENTIILQNNGQIQQYFNTEWNLMSYENHCSVSYI